MSVLLADIDATCAALGFNDGGKYHAEPDALQGLKHLIWVLKRDLDNHEYRRHLGHGKVLQTDLVPMLIEYVEDEDFFDVLIRLLIVLTNPTQLLYREGLPKDGPGRKIFLELVEILQGYKEAFTSDYLWAVLTVILQKNLEMDWALRSEDQGLTIERVLVLVRNVLHVPPNPELECRADNDASLHDQVIWALHQSGMLDLVLYILSCTDENQYHLHALEIVCLMFREQTAESLVDASLQRSAAEKHRDAQELLAVRRREKQRLIARPPPGRHSRFGGTYVLQNVKSVSDKDIICHQSLERAFAIDFDREKSKQKRSHRMVKEETTPYRRSAFSIRLCLREYCIEVLRSAYNTMVRQVRRVLERNSGCSSHDDSYLLWAIRFFMEFNRLSGLQLHLVSESLSVQCFHWVLTRIEHDMDNMAMDKSHARVWGKRLHVALQTFRELLLSLLALQKIRDDRAQALFDMLLNNICYVLEYREMVLHLLMNYNEAQNTREYLRDVVEVANIFIKIMEKFCKDPVVVQDKKRQRRKGSKKSKGNPGEKKQGSDENLEDAWAVLASEVSTLLSNGFTLPAEEQPIPFDAASDKAIEDQKEDCMLKIHKLLREERSEHAIALMRAAREVWPEDDCFGSLSPAPEDELMVLREIYLSKLDSAHAHSEEADEDDEENSEDNEEEEDEQRLVEKDFRFEDFARRLLHPKVVRACTIVLSDWQMLSPRTLKSVVTILYRIAYECKCPAMLYQAKLFTIFQDVFKTPKEAHNQELRRLAMFVVRKFVETAPSNPKIYAELLFYKTLKEANDLEFGYDGAWNVGIKGAWTEEQENELRMLFEENQNNPESDKDVIDWILDNLIDKTRTSRGVMKKLKEMGLLFKNPTKRSLAASMRNLWKHEEDEQIRALYDEHRLEENCLERMMAAFGKSRTKNQIIKRMIELHIIADRSEVIAQKQKKSKSKKDSENTFDSAEEEPNFAEVAKTLSKKATKKTNSKGANRKIGKAGKVTKAPLDVSVVRFLVAKIDEKFVEVLNWLKESLEEAMEDIVEPSDDRDDGIPLLPLQAIQKEAMEDTQFKKLLISIGMQPPIEEMETYWRIPAYLTAFDLQTRVNVINGTPHIEEEGLPNIVTDDEDEAERENQNEPHNETSDEGDLHENFLSKRRERLDNLTYNKSDNEDEHREPLQPKLNKKRTKPKDSSQGTSGGSQTRRRGKFNINDMIKEDTELDTLDINSENLRQQHPAEHSGSDSDVSDKDEVRMRVSSHGARRSRHNVIDSESSGDEIESADLLTIQENSIARFEKTNNSLGGDDAAIIASTQEHLLNSHKSEKTSKIASKRTHADATSDSDSEADGILKKTKLNHVSESRRRRLVIPESEDDE